MRTALVAVLALLLAAPARAGEQRPTQVELEARVMCPVCKTTLEQSDSPAAQRIKSVIAQKIAAGQTRSRIEAELVEQFGPAILAAPPRRGFDLLAWWLPIALLLAGVLAVAAAAWHWSRVREQEPPPVAATSAGPLDPELERRLDDELRRFDA